MEKLKPHIAAAMLKGGAPDEFDLACLGAAWEGRTPMPISDELRRSLCVVAHVPVTVASCEWSNIAADERQRLLEAMRLTVQLGKKLSRLAEAD